MEQQPEAEAADLSPDPPSNPLARPYAVLGALGGLYVAAGCNGRRPERFLVIVALTTALLAAALGRRQARWRRLWGLHLVFDALAAGGINGFLDGVLLLVVVGDPSHDPGDLP